MNFNMYTQTNFVLIFTLVLPSFAATVQDTDKDQRYHWRTGDWKSCYAAQGCGGGQRERIVWCQDTLTDTTTSLYLCRPGEEPPRIKNCFVACRHHKDHLQWRIIDWGPCTPTKSPLGNWAGMGIMKGNATCVLTTHEGSQDSLQIDDENCLMISARPVGLKDCTLPTRQDCVVTEWSPWTSCCDSTQHRTRSVLVAPHDGGRQCPQLSEWRSCDSEDNNIDSDSNCSPHVEGIRLRMDKWGECRPSHIPEQVWDGENSGRTDNYYKHWPQVGTQHREVTCLNTSGDALPLSSCIKERGEYNLPLRERACIIAQDCAVSEWTEWSVIQEGCIDATGNVWAEMTERRREVLRLHEGQGQSCPHLIETKSTTTNLSLCSHKYSWLVSKWSPCTLPNVMKEVVCGGGLQFRNITCVAFQGGQPLPSKSCHTIQPPPTVQRCEVACPRDCEVGPWGSWGPCQPLRCPPNDEINLNMKGHRKRSRSVIVPPSALGQECPSLTEIQSCPHPQCYVWSIDAWGACQLDQGNTKCGTGRRTRRVACTTQAESTELKEVVADWLCTQLKPPTDEPCLLPCPFDCVVSGWSSWSPCSLPCTTKNKMPMRHRNRTVIAPHGSGGHTCPNPDEMLQVDGCNPQGCHGFSWLTLPWQPCNATCDSGEGVQTREVWCVQDNQEAVNASRCELLPKPSTSRTCVQDCPVQCEVSPWSEWSPCPSLNCMPNGTRALATSQTRYRVVIQGQNCGPLEEVRDCFIPDEPCPHYYWSSGEWSKCQLAHGVRCGHGLRTRDLWCSEEDSDKREELRYCLATRIPLPVTVQRCHVDCHAPCQMTEWSAWTLCTQPCSGKRSRTRQLIGLSDGHAQCLEISLSETKSCPCAQYFSRPVSNWSSCLTNDSMACGAGTRYRAVGCYNDKDQMVDPSLCGGENGLQEEPCLVPCPVDCKMSDWSPWGECNVLCGPGLQNRTSHIIQHGSDGGRMCGPTTQWKLCNVPCEVFQWQVGGWSECILIPADRDQGCGTGDQYRQVRCVDTRSGTAVDDDFCDWTTQPVDINACHVACPGDCVLSAWSEWSLCNKGCVGNGQQQRTRSLLRAAANSGAMCPHMIQTQACQLNITCFTYKWVETNFSSCLPLGGSPCGEGMTTRAVYCQRSDGRPVEDTWCGEETKPSPAEKWCYVDCPVDCHVAEWSDWNATRCHCGESGISRHAFISTNPSSSGRPCPSPLVQWKPCPALPCYSWDTSPWYECQLHGATCGHGIKNRNVTCTRGGDNTTVDSWHCMGSNNRKPVSWETCHIPCESDCQLSEWSHWSHCHGDCLKDKQGYATRSRAVLRLPQSNGGEPCPEALWETRTCDLGPCLTFQWTITSTGQIICQRSDGLHVVGGCDGKRKQRPCEWKGGRCVCIEGAVVEPQIACSEQAEVQARLYYPKDDDLNVWMFAMFGIGSVFIMFVISSIYLLWSVYSSSSNCKDSPDHCHLIATHEEGKSVNMLEEDDS